MPNPHDEAVTLELSPEHAEVLDGLARSHARGAPEGWLRIVLRQECSAVPEIAGAVSVHEVVRRTPDGLVQEAYDPPDDLYFETMDMLEELAAASPTKTVVLELVVDRDGSHTGRIVQDVPRVLAGIRDDTSSKPVHEYLERNRAELEAMAARLG